MVGEDGTSSFAALLKKLLLYGAKDKPAWISVDEKGLMKLVSGPLLDVATTLASLLPTHANETSGWRLEQQDVAHAKTFLDGQHLKKFIENVGKAELKNIKNRLKKVGNHEQAFLAALRAAQLKLFSQRLEKYSSVAIAEFIPLKAVMHEAPVVRFLSSGLITFADALELFGYNMLQTLQRVARAPSPLIGLQDEAADQLVSSSAASSSSQPTETGGGSSSAPLSPSSGEDAASTQVSSPPVTAADFAAGISMAVTGQPDLNETILSVTENLQAGAITPDLSTSASSGDVLSSSSDMPELDELNPPARAAEVVAANRDLQTAINSSARQRKADSSALQTRILTRLQVVGDLAANSFEAIDVVKEAMKEMSSELVRLQDVPAAIARIEAQQQQLLDMGRAILALLHK